MSDVSDILALPYLQPSQAQKHVTHNEALRILDRLVQLAVDGFDATTPPAAPQDGEAWALGATPSGAWAGHAGEIAVRSDGAWSFITPQEGWRAAGRDSGTLRLFVGGQWVLPPAAQDNLDRIGIGTAADAVNRLAVAAEASLLSHAGAGHQLKVNKALPADTASLLFQSGWSGRAEMGLAGADDFSVKVSADGSAWQNALEIDAANGRARFPQGASVGGFLNIGPVQSVTIANGVITVTGSYHRLDTESGAGSDHLDTIQGGQDGDLLLLRTSSSNRDVIVRHATGNIYCDQNRTLNNLADRILLQNISGTQWHMISYANN